MTASPASPEPGGPDAATLLDRYGADRTRLLDMLWDLQDTWRYVPEPVLADLAPKLGTTLLDLRETASFYHFFHDRYAGRHTIYLSTSVLAQQCDYDAVLATLERETGTLIGGVDPSGAFGLFETPCIGLSDQEPAMLVDSIPFTRLNSAKVTSIIAGLKAGHPAVELADPEIHDSRTVEYVDSLVESNLRLPGVVFFRPDPYPESFVERLLTRPPEEIVEILAESELRGRGGAGFSTGVKWRMVASAPGPERYVICNADEGEPGTFKDRVLLTRSPRQVLLGMIAAAYAVGARHGILYLRGEYSYLRDYLEQTFEEFRARGLLGTGIGGRAGFDFDLRVQRGAGAYVCGEESALLESCEGKRGTPRVKPPFPAQSGFLGLPTCIDNVETFAAAARVLEEGSRWFRAVGTEDSAGTRLLSVAGDVSWPGVYEIEWGTTLGEVLEHVGAPDAHAVQIGGPSGVLVAAAEARGRRIAFEDLPCNGALTIFDPTRDLVDITRQHLDFFVAESCGICVPCRAGNVELRDFVARLQAGRASRADFARALACADTVRRASRCGLGATSPKPLLSTVEAFPAAFEAKLVDERGPLLASYVEDEAVVPADVYRSVREGRR
ncbi:MAG: NAD(P)H-dependent oxidoreductase subunit E [Nocardioides sp.]